MAEYSINENFYFSLYTEQRGVIPDLNTIYGMSILSLDDHFDTCAMLSIETSNDQETLDNMDFWKFTKLVSSVNKYLERKNAAENGETSSSDAKDQFSKQQAEMKSSMKNMMPSKNTFK